MSAKKQLLDPVGSLCRLPSLIFCDDNTKISIQDHILSLHEPTGYQFFIRMCNGDGRENISELYYIIIRLIKWYLVPSDNININISSTPPSVSHMSQQYIKIQEPTAKDPQSEQEQEQEQEQEPEQESEKHHIEIESIIDEDYQNSEHYENIISYNNTTNSSEKSNKSNKSSIFSEIVDNTNCTELSKSIELKKMIEYLCQAFEKLQRRTYEYGNVVLALQFYINLLRDALKGTYNDNMLPKYILEKDSEYENLLDYNKLRNLWSIKKFKRICDLYDNCFKVLNDKAITNEKTRDNLIKSYLRSIDSMLEEADREFQKLIQNSNNG